LARNLDTTATESQTGKCEFSKSIQAATESQPVNRNKPIHSPSNET